MANRRLYGRKLFEVDGIEEYDHVWHLVGFFTDDSIKSKFRIERRVRVKPDERWNGVKAISFKEDRIYESESIWRATRHHVYGSGKWYVSPSSEDGKGRSYVRSEFGFEDFSDVRHSVRRAPRGTLAAEHGKLYYTAKFQFLPKRLKREIRGH